MAREREAEADGGRSAFCEREHGRLVGALTLYTGDRELALEVAQEALAQACRDWPRVSQMAAPGAWVHRVAVNLANRGFRRALLERRARERSSARPIHHEAPDHADALVVRAAVAGLPRRQRTALVLRYYSDLPVDQVAELMGCRPGTVKALTSQAITALRASGCLHDLEEPR